MTKTIWKFELPHSIMQLPIPKGYQVLDVQTQGGMPYLWVMVDPDADMIPVTIHTARTGHPLPDDIDKYLGTYQVQGGALIFHVFILIWKG